jgi:predicted dehydrogenase
MHQDNDTLRVGVVGVGHLGYHHARHYAASEAARLVGVADPDEARGREVAEAFGTRWYLTAEALAGEGLDACSIVAPTTRHADLAGQLLAAGIDCLVEKPIASTVAEGEAMVAAAERHGRILQVGHIERFNGAVVAMMRAAARPRFIECHRLSPYPNRGQDVSVVHDLMIHDIEIIQALAGSDVTSVDAVGLPVFSPTEDIANARIRTASGCVCNLTVSRVSVERMRKIRVFTDDAYMSTDYTEQEVLLFRKKPGDLAPGQNPMELIAMEALPVHKEEPLKLEIAAFLECVRTREAPTVGGRQGLAALAIAERVMDAIRRPS